MASRPASPPNRRLLRIAGYVVACVPATVVGGQALAGKLGANPIEALLNRLGWWALVVLLASLACTPLRFVLRSNALGSWRRILGLAAFWYALAHLSTYAVLDKFFDVADIWADVIKRPFITVGFAAFCLLLLLAITSPAAVARRLGGQKWRALHRLVYVAATLGIVHFLWRVKADLREPLIFASVLALLLGFRVLWAVRKRRRAAIPVTPA